MNKSQSFFLIGLICFASLFLYGCDLARNSLKADRSGGMQMQDYRDMLAPRVPDDEAKTAEADNIPGLQPYIAPPSERMKSMPLVSISVNQSVPLRDILFELAQQADHDLELDPAIKGSIIFTARNRPFDQVVERISEIAGLRYRFDDDVLRVELDTPYNKTYKVDYLSYVRSNEGKVRNDIAVVSGEGTDTGSSFEATSNSQSDFWGELEANLQQMLGGPSSNLRTKRDPRITATEQNPDVRSVAPQTTETGMAQIQPPDAVLRVDSLPVEEEDFEDDFNNSDPENPTGQTYTINRQAGLINVYATEHAHKEIQDYLQLLRRSVTAQVLIEAKILEVSLNDRYSTGIDWRFIDAISPELTVNFISDSAGAALDGLGPSTASLGLAGESDSSLVLGYTGNDIQGVIEALQRFGAVKALASPRLTVLNNQSAVLNVATNQVFFEIDIDSSQTDSDVVTVDIDSEIRNVPEGVLVNVQPSINLDNHTISMAVRPTITRIVNEVADPSVAFAASLAEEATEIQSLIPELNVQEIDSVIQVRSGQPVVMGGLLQDRVDINESGLPVLSEVPMVGSLFKQHTDTVQKTELVILLKATILTAPSDSIHDTDRDIYRAFSGDRRPFSL